MKKVANKYLIVVDSLSRGSIHVEDKRERCC